MSIFDIFKQLSESRSGGSSLITGKPEIIIAGLGNPGLAYEGTRHNAGFMAAEALASKYGAEVKKLKFRAKTGEAVINGVKCLLLKPETYMNNSGEAVAAAMDYYKIPIENVIVCFDDISLPVSKIRIRLKGSDGGHNGIKSIIQLIGSDNFPRVKIGVGERPNPGYDLKDWVLSKFTKEELPKIREALDNCVSALELMAHKKFDEAMNRFN